MKSFFRKIVVSILAYESKVILGKFRPHIVAITGNVGKTTTKDYIYNVLKFKFNDEVLATEKSQNSEFGVPLTLLKGKNAWNNPLKWMKVIFINFFKVLFSRSYAEKLVLEIGADHPGDIKQITNYMKPDVVVLTAFQDRPTHGEFFLSKELHLAEKNVLVKALKKGGTIIYNIDDESMSSLVYAVPESKQIEKFSYGKHENADLQILEVTNVYGSDEKIKGAKFRFRNKIKEDEGALFEINITGILGEAQAYSIAASILVGLIFGLTREEIQDSFAELELPKSRMRILEGANDSIIIDDSYNASPIAYINAIKTIENIFVKGKKIFVMGHMAELGKQTKDAHIEVGAYAASVANEVILSGRHNDFFLEGLRSAKFPMEKVFLAKNSQEVVETINRQDLLKENDLLFIKGSAVSNRPERVVVSFLKNREDREFVCRQEPEWLKLD